MKLLLALLTAVPALAVDFIHTPSAKTLQPHTGAVDFQFHQLRYTTGAGNAVISRFETVMLLYAPLPSLELSTEFSYGRTEHQRLSVPNRGNVTVGAKYRLAKKSYEGGEAVFTIGERIELPSNDFQALWTGRLSTVEAAYLSLSHGTNFRTSVLASASKTRLYVGTYAEYTYRTEQRSVRLGNDLTVGGVVSMSLTSIQRTPQVAVLLDAWYQDMAKAKIYGIPFQGTGGNQVVVAPGVSLGLTPRLSLKASYIKPISQQMGPLVPYLTQGLMFGIGYRF